jgi:hypothetical protein
MGHKALKTPRIAGEQGTRPWRWAAQAQRPAQGKPYSLNRAKNLRSHGVVVEGKSRKDKAMTQITEIAPDLYRISTFLPEVNLQFNQFLVRDEQL